MRALVDDGLPTLHAVHLDRLVPVLCEICLSVAESRKSSSARTFYRYRDVILRQTANKVPCQDVQSGRFAIGDRPTMACYIHNSMAQ